jgi:acyl-CoA thioester hydrolase
VYWEDTDAGGVVYYASYLRFIERARAELFRAMGVEQSVLKREKGIAFAVRSLEAEFLRPAILDDELTIFTDVTAVGRVQFTLEQRIERADKPLFTAKVRLACLDLEEMKPAAIPPEIVRGFESLLKTLPAG